jgi:hypothetical protein
MPEPEPCLIFIFSFYNEPKLFKKIIDHTPSDLLDDAINYSLPKNWNILHLLLFVTYGEYKESLKYLLQKVSASALIKALSASSDEGYCPIAWILFTNSHLQLFYETLNPKIINELFQAIFDLNISLTHALIINPYFPLLMDPMPDKLIIRFANELMIARLPHSGRPLINHIAEKEVHIFNIILHRLAKIEGWTKVYDRIDDRT